MVSSSSHAAEIRDGVSAESSKGVLSVAAIENIVISNSVVVPLTSLATSRGLPLGLS